MEVTSKTRVGSMVNPPSTIDPNYEKDSYENDSERASEPGADTPFTQRDTAALTSDDQASQPRDWERASPRYDGS
jgi:hypothetical protein